MNATPIDNIVKKKGGLSKQHLLVAGVFLVLASVLGITAFTLRQQVATTQTTQTKAYAPLPACLPDYGIPLPADPACYACKRPPYPGFKGDRAIADKTKDGLNCETIVLDKDTPNEKRYTPIKVGVEGRDFQCSWCPQDAPTQLQGSNDNWLSCTSPHEGFCKSKGATCAECRGNEFRIVCKCSDNSPTPPEKTPSIACPVPNVVTNVSISCPSCAQ